METKHYVPLEIARRLKEKGYQRGKYAANEMALPTYEQAVGWIDRQSGMLVSTLTIYNNQSDKPNYYGIISTEGKPSKTIVCEPTKEQALNRTIIKALELI